MCGIVGVFALNKTGVAYDDFNVFHDLLRVASLRGTDGSGLFYVGDEATGLKKNKTSWVKIGAIPEALLNSKEYKSIVGDLRNSRFLVGHCRSATVGEAKTNNTHPFSRNHITLVHNGTLRSVPSELGKFDVDSDALCSALTKDEPKKVFDTVFGAIATIWYDSKERKLKVYRNSERPLYYAKTYNDKWYVASEAGMLNWILERNKINNVKVKPTLFDSGKLYEFSHDKDDPEETEVKQTYQGQHWSPAQKGYTDGYWDDEYGWVPNSSRQAMLANRQTTPDTCTTNVIALSDLRKDTPKDNSGKRELKHYFDVAKGDELVFVPVGREAAANNRKRIIITGKPVQNQTKNKPINQMVAKSKFITTVGVTDAEDLYNSDYYKGKVMAILVDQKVPANVTFYIAHTAAIGFEGAIQ